MVAITPIATTGTTIVIGVAIGRTGTGIAAIGDVTRAHSSIVLKRRRGVRDNGPDPIDIFVGRRLREQRLLAGLSQTESGRCIGVSFQAVQKYESASVRISASTLYQVAQALGVEPGYFFEGYSESAPTGRRAQKQKLR